MKMFESVAMNNLTVKNRLLRSATWEGLVSPEGFLNDEVYAIYEELARGGVGTIVTGLTDVSPYDWAIVGNMRLYNDCLIDDYRKLAQIVHQYDCKILPQLNMDTYHRAERHVMAVDLNDMTQQDLETTKDWYVTAAARAKDAGFDGVQLHLAYGWFLNRFINPAYNHRMDCYGGSTENRVRLVGEIICMIKKAIPNYHISAKFSFFNDAFGDIAVQECVAICKELEKAGLDSVEILAGHSAKENGTNYETCYLDLGIAAKGAVSIPVILTGNNHSIDIMEAAATMHQIDLFGLSRALIREPQLPNQWKNGNASPAKCVSCGRCYTTHGKRCVFNIQK